MADTKDRRLRPPKLVPIAVTACLAGILGLGGAAAVAATPPVQRGAVARPAVHHDVSPPLRALVNSGTPGRAYPARPLPGRASQQADAARQAALGGSQAPTLGLGFDGMGNGFSGFSLDSAPPDPAGAVGPNHYVQIVNEGVTVFNKSGTPVYGPVATNTFWSGFGGLCQNDNDGDGIVAYDRQANRWVISQFAVSGANGSSVPYLECIAVSKTADPTGQYNRYSFGYSQFPDYPKVAVWPDAYYVTYNMFTSGFTGAKACALDRTKMLAGLAATQQCFDTGSTYGSLLGSDLDSSAAPPAGSPNYLVALGADTSSLAYWKFHVDFTTPANTTFTGPSALTVTTYSEACGGDNSCIPQSGTNTVLDSLGDRLMYRLAYRNFGDHEALVVNHSIVSGTAVGVRWYELRVGGGNSLSVFQQGTFAPDTTYRWLGSAAMDKNGDIALGYSTSSSSLHPGIRYTARVPGDPAGTMGQGEGTVITGAGSQTQNLSRWGDYSSLTVDPSDDCTFWYVNEYIPSNGSFNWRTRIATFNVAGCTGALPAPPAAPTGVSASSSNGSVSLTWAAVSGATSYKVFRGTSPGGEGSTPVGTPSGTSFNDTGRTNGTTYYYKVVASNAGGDSAPSNEVSATPVATPTGLSATPSGTSVSLDWSDAAGATSYRVFRGTSPGGESSTPVGTPSGSSFNDTGLTAGNHYYYKVSAVNSTGSSPQSGEANALLAPPAPLNVHATPGDGQVSLTWSAANGAASYKVFRHTQGGALSQVGTATGTSFNDTAVTNGTQYFYSVKATNATGDGPASSPEASATPSTTPPPPAPGNLTATAGNGSVSLSWSASSGATGYRVYRGIAPGGESLLASSSGTSFTDTGLTNGQTYYYRVSAVGAGGEGAQSGEASATPQAPAQPPPSGIATTTTTTTTSTVPPIPLPPQLIPAVADTTAPTLTIAGVGKQKLSDALKKGVAVDLGCSEACTDSVTLLLDFKTAHALHLAAKKPVKVGGKGFTLSAGHRKVRVPFSSKAKKRLRRARTVTVTVQVAGRDKSGNKTTKSKRLKLR